MKKLLALMLALVVMMNAGAMAAEVDLSAMSEEELLSLIDAARLELTKYLPCVTDGTLLYEDENVRITLDGELYMEYGSLVIPVVLENMSGMNLILSLDYPSCNGWDLMDATASVSANKKAKATFEFYSADEMAELASAADVQDITCSVRYFDEDTFETICESESITWVFGK